MRLKIHLDRMEYEFFNKKGQNFNSALLNPCNQDERIRTACQISGKFGMIY